MNPRVELFNLIGVLARRRFQEGERAFASLGLNHTEARLLTLLSEHKGEAKQDVLSAMVNVDRSNVGRALKGLEQRRLVSRCKDSHNGKTFQVTLTEIGREAAKQLIGKREEMALSLFGKLSEEEAAAAFALLQNCAAAPSPLSECGKAEGRDESAEAEAN